MKYAAALAILATGCGYHVGTRGDLIPSTVKSISIPPLGNATTRQRLPVLLTSDVTREFISRTKYSVTADANRADVVLTGAVIGFGNYPTIFDPVSGRATGVQVVVTMQLTLTERSTGKVLYTRSGVEFRERYEITTDPQAYFDESGTAMRRVSRDIARSVVSEILNAF